MVSNPDSNSANTHFMKNILRVEMSTSEYSLLVTPTITGNDGVIQQCKEYSRSSQLRLGAALDSQGT